MSNTERWRNTGASRCIVRKDGESTMTLKEYMEILEKRKVCKLKELNEAWSGEIYTNRLMAELSTLNTVIEELKKLEEAQ